jgi:hypothetical protein
MKKISYAVVLAALVLLAGFLLRDPKPAQPSPTASVSPTVTQSVLGQTTKTTGCTVTNGLPDTACTPGGIDPKVTQDNIQSTICVSGYSSGVRPAESVTNKIKKERLLAYGDSDSMSDYELDHLVSLELGGCPDCVANLWPEPYNIPLGARQKDTVENYLHKQVCNGAMSLHDAQEAVATDWESVYNQLPKN